MMPIFSVLPVGAGEAGCARTDGARRSAAAIVAAALKRANRMVLNIT
jgi:hypothetical protein